MHIAYEFKYELKYASFFFSSYINTHADYTMHNVDAVSHRCVETVTEGDTFGWQVMVVANRALKKGEEIFLDYGDKFEIDGKIPKRKFIAKLKLQKKKNARERLFLKKIEKEKSSLK